MSQFTKRIAVLIGTIVSAFTLQAEQTAYEKRCYEIYEKYYTLFSDGYSHPLSASDALVFSISPQLHVLTAAMEAMWYFSQEQIDNYVDKMSAELKKAESLMTAEERAKKAEAEALAKMKETSVGAIRLLVQDAVNQWAQKGEFEKTEEYKSRVLNNVADQYSTICLSVFPNDLKVQASPLKYDADKEQYEFTLKYSFYANYKVYAENLSFFVPLNVETARSLTTSSDFIVYDCVWGASGMKIMPQAFKIVVNGLSYSVTTKAEDLIIKSNELNLTMSPISPLLYNYSDTARQMIVKKEQYLSELSDLQMDRQQEIDSVNSILQSSPYFGKVSSYYQQRLLLSPQAQSFTSIDDYYKIAAYRDTLLQRKSVSQLIEEQNNAMLEYVWKNNPKGYLEVYLEENTTLKDSLLREYQEYRCHYSNFYYYAEKHFKQSLSPSERDCREHAWLKASDYYLSRAEFDEDYSLGEEGYNEKLDKHRSLMRSLESLEGVLGSQISNPAANAPFIGSFVSNTKSVGDLNLQGANDSNNPTIQRIVSLYAEVSEHPDYQLKAAEKIIETNAKVKKEFDKNGSAFSSITDFLSAYFSSDYKKILKSASH